MLAHLKHHCTWSSITRLQLINKFITFPRIIQQKSHFCDESKNRPNPNDSELKETEQNPIISANMESRYDLFTDDSTTIILDIEEEREKLHSQPESEPNQDGKWIIPKNISRERKRYHNVINQKIQFNSFDFCFVETGGKTGVFDIDELVEVLKSDKARNICVLAIPPELKYVDYLCIVTAKSHRHMDAMSQFVRKMYKIKKNPKDLFIKVEGKDSKDWMAMDLGNIALHMLSDETRKKFDIEQLWAVGSEYDELSNQKEDSLLKLFNESIKPLPRPSVSKRNDE